MRVARIGETTLLLHRVQLIRYQIDKRRHRQWQMPPARIQHMQAIALALVLRQHRQQQACLEILSDNPMR